MTSKSQFNFLNSTENVQGKVGGGADTGAPAGSSGVLNLVPEHAAVSDANLLEAGSSDRSFQPPLSQQLDPAGPSTEAQAGSDTETEVCRPSHAVLLDQRRHLWIPGWKALYLLSMIAMI
jgi:hypothetical protein